MLERLLLLADLGWLDWFAALVPFIVAHVSEVSIVGGSSLYVDFNRTDNFTTVPSTFALSGCVHVLLFVVTCFLPLFTLSSRTRSLSVRTGSIASCARSSL